ncbi:site-specific integrase [Saccharopolyspora sp. 6V]|uniref:tyrosine-type recombinase/integrase n=1 Tax=Saccharopolyspora sp. 6V TaxID=2877239 RepID=UPI001CD3D27D|nr:site-specific integrase [Saccharopolyspora sp. 6V]MCA1192785.1 site-specific integrase [Saccharopolyspora sp. 6V]
MPDYYRSLVAVAGGAGLRWGEVVGLCPDALDLEAGTLSVIRTVVEVSRNTSFKPFPKSSAGRRSVPLPPWPARHSRDHLREWPPSSERAPVFANMAGKPHRRTLFRSRVRRPSLVLAGLLGQVTEEDGGFVAIWLDAAGEGRTEKRRTHSQAVKVAAANAGEGLRFHDLRHSYATWLVDDGVPVNMVQRVLGHERSSTTPDLYTRRTDGGDRMLRALTDEADDGLGPR